MKRLLLVRHAKSSWKQANLSDFERPLNERGLQDAPVMGRRIAEYGYAVELIVTSPAKRARTTSELIAQELSCDPERIVEQPGIYECGAADLEDIVRGLDDSFTTVMLVGHNPVISECVKRLCPADIEPLPTAAVVEIQFHASRWAEIDRRASQLVRYDYPKLAAPR